MSQIARFVGAIGCAVVLGIGAGVSSAHAQAVSDSTYVVEQGDTLFRIAQETGASIRALQTWNDLDGTNISIGDTLHVRPPGTDAPARPDPTPENAPSERTLADELPPVEPDTSRDTTPADSNTTDEAPSPDDHASDDVTVDRPEHATWMDLALRTGVTADSLWRLNDRPDTLPDRIRLPANAVAEEGHVVDEGETLYSIAGQYGASVRALQAANDLEGTDLDIGTRLRIPGQHGSLPTTWAAPDTIQADIFPSSFTGRLTASGISYDPDALVASHSTLPFDSIILLSHPLDAEDEAHHVYVRIVDRSVNGPEISQAAAQALELDGEASLALRVVWRSDG